MSLDGHLDVCPAIVVESYDMVTGERFEAHVHDEHQLVWAASGVVTVEVGTQFWVLPPTLALFVPAGVTHATSATKPTLMHGIYLATARVGWTSPTVVAIDGLLRELLDALGSERLPSDAHAHAEALVLGLLTPVSVATITVPGGADERLHAVVERLLADPSDDRSLAAWGRAVGAGERTLSRLFVEETGLTFGQWRTQARLRAALVLLAEGVPVSRVACDVGFKTASAFVASFRRSTGSTPRAYFREARHHVS